MTIEKIILDSIKSAKNEIIDGVLNTVKPETPKTEIRRTEMSGSKSADGQNNSNVSIINAYSRNKRLNIMVIGAALGLIFCLLMLTSYKRDLPGEVVGIISTISGIFGACLKDAYSFEFGSSRGSKDKDDKISSTILERMKH
ncbi:MAG: hypothetical protein LBQ08_03335 [Holosporaceae bacterium]|jgi:hypothetical protein|nr:hypothetical protein [Holosporaceae bacterium]